MFKLKPYPRPPRPALGRIDGCRGVIRPAGTEIAAIPKDSRNMLPGDQERLWKHVRSLPCARCWKEGRTEVSHSNQLIDGKGKSIKSYPWRIAALCHECHAMIDQGKDMSKSERMEAWNASHRWTMGKLFEEGLVRPV